ncbi:hypothetical protein EDB83DRAFT_1985724 [Lactarius deliciosus]|nr:hypothetical protein EDB83DRAFT_1985724 [Lactarius deliciosus]
MTASFALQPPIVIVINIAMSIISHASCICIPSHQPRLFCQCQSAFVVISLSYALPRPLFSLTSPSLCPSAGLTSFLRSGLLIVLAGAAAMPIDPSLLAVRSHGTLAFHLYIHCTLPPSNLTYITPTFVCVSPPCSHTSPQLIMPRLFLANICGVAFPLTLFTRTKSTTPFPHEPCIALHFLSCV